MVLLEATEVPWHTLCSVLGGAVCVQWYTWGSLPVLETKTQRTVNRIFTWHTSSYIHNFCLFVHYYFFCVAITSKVITQVHKVMVKYYDVCVIYWCSDASINSQEYESFDIYAVIIKISMTEYHHLINRTVLMVQSKTAVYGGIRVW